jgi:ABC-type bacteriocin/lantibiotic exporter with double-glycine peptidase domain
MKYVIQKDDTGCGLACIAMLSGKSYDVVIDYLKKIKGVKKISNLKTNYTELIRTGQHFKFNLNKRKKFSKWIDIPATAIASTDFTPTKKEWHWVVFRSAKSGKPYIIDPNDSKGNGEKKRFNLRGKHCGSYLLLQNTFKTN